MKKQIGMIFLLMTILLMGCSGNQDFKPAGNSIFLKQDGTIVSADIEAFDKSHYSQEELAAFVEENVIEYNQETAGLSYAYADDSEDDLPVAIEKCEVTEQKAELWLTYINSDHYLAFNEDADTPDSIYINTVENAAAAGYSFDLAFKKADGSSAVKEDVLKKENHHIGIVEGSGEIQVDGKITFVTANVTVSGENKATLTDGEVSYIIFK